MLSTGPEGEDGRAPRVEPSWTLSHASLPLADFNLHPHVVINYNHEYNSKFCDSFY